MFMISSFITIQRVRTSVDESNVRSELASLSERTVSLEEKASRNARYIYNLRNRPLQRIRATIKKMTENPVDALIPQLRAELLDVLAYDAFPGSVRKSADGIIRLLDDISDGYSMADALSEGPTDAKGKWLPLGGALTNADLYPQLVSILLDEEQPPGEDHAFFIRNVVYLQYRHYVGRCVTTRTKVSTPCCNTTPDDSEQCCRLRCLRTSMDRLVEDVEQALKANTREIFKITLGLHSLALIVGIILFLVVLLGLRPVNQLIAGVRQMAKGDLYAEIKIRSKDEIGQIGEEFNEMAKALRQQRQALVRAERLAAVGRMAANVAHEVRNPLNAIALNVELIEEAIQSDESEQIESLLAAVRAEVERLTEVTEAYLRFAAMPKPQPEPVDLASICRDLASFQREEARRLGLAIMVETPAPLPAMADPDQIRQALLNLLKNAIDASSKGGHITVQAQAEGNMAKISVEDDGPGIDPQIIDQIFEPFYSSKKHGTGLGLALARRVSETHNGSLEYVPPPPGRTGARFVMSLPLHVDDKDDSQG